MIIFFFFIFQVGLINNAPNITRVTIKTFSIIILYQKDERHKEIHNWGILKSVIKAWIRRLSPLNDRHVLSI